MADKNNPFFPFANFDLSKMDLGQFDFNKMLQDVNVPGVNMQALVEAQRRNLEALTAANQMTLQGMQAVAKRQAEILAQAMAEVAQAGQELASSGNPQQMSAKQAELVKEAFERAIGNTRELAELVNRTNNEASDVINKRISESLDELRDLLTRVDRS